MLHHKLLAAAPVLLLLLLALSSPAEGRRVRYRTRPVQTEEDQQQYYQPAATDVETERAGVVLVSSDPYNGLYGRPSAQTDTAEPALSSRYRGSPAAASSRAISVSPRTKEPKQPPVQTIRNYSKVNDDGSFTFGYESADGSFKEETRGTDCVVRGKYGYVDPDGNKREFTYVSGNPCDPNAPAEQDSSAQQEDDSGEENIPKVPIRPLRPVRPTVAPTRPPTTTTVFQNDYRQQGSAEDEVDDEPQQLYSPQPAARPAYSYPSTSSLYHTYDDQQVTTPAPAVYRAPQQPVSITPRPRPAYVSSTLRSQLPATTYRPQIFATATPRPTTTASTTTQLYGRTASPPVIYHSSTANPYASSSQAQLYGRTNTLYQPSSTAASVSSAEVNFDEELRKFQLENNVLTTPRTAQASPAAYSQHLEPVRHAQLPLVSRQQQPVPQARKVPAASAGSSDPIYTSELVYDPSTGQYNTVLYQSLPQTQGELNLRASIQPYVAPQQSQQNFYQQLLQSQQLYAQQRARNRYEVTTQPPARQQPQYRQAQQPQPQRYYYVASPAAPVAVAPGSRESVSHGQIDAFLRGHNIAF